MISNPLREFNYMIHQATYTNIIKYSWFITNKKLDKVMDKKVRKAINQDIINRNISQRKLCDILREKNEYTGSIFIENQKYNYTLYPYNNSDKFVYKIEPTYL